MITNITVLLILVTMTSVAPQTFQYSRGWTNGKRDGHKQDISLDKILTPCQMHKLKYLLAGKPFTERLLTPCDFPEEDNDQPKRYKSDHGQDTLYDAFQ